MRLLGLPSGYRVPRSRVGAADEQPGTRTAELDARLTSAPDAESRTRALIDLAVWCADAEPALAVGFGERAVEEAGRSGDPLLQTRARYAHAVARLFGNEDFPGPCAELLALRKRFAEMSSPRDAAWCDHMAGVGLEYLGDPGGAVVLYDRALAAFRELRDLAGEARCLNSIGCGEGFVGRWAEALAQFDRAAELSEVASAPGTYGLAALNAAEARTELGMAALHEGGTDLAHRLFEQARTELDQLAVFVSAISYPFLAPLVASRQAVVLLHLDQPDQALAAAEQALRLGTQADSGQALAAARCTAGQVYLELGDPARAAELLAGALSQYEQWGLHFETARILRGLVEAHERLGAIATAYDLHKRLLIVEIARRAATAKRENEVIAARLELARDLGAVDRFNSAELAEANAQLKTERIVLERLAHTDPLTGLANRRYFDAQLSRFAVRAELSRRPLGLILVDVDHFKSVNDRASHVVGDAVLRRVAGVVGDHGRSGDLAARVGGEEFALLLPGADVADARLVAERLRTAITRIPCDDLLTGWELTASLGVAVMAPRESADGLLAAADFALYEAKRTGRNRVCAATD